MMTVVVRSRRGKSPEAQSLRRAVRIEIVRAMRAPTLTFLLCVSFASETAAQRQDPWLVVPVTSSEDDSWMEPTALKVRSELLERGLDVWSLDGAATRFEADGSATAAKISDADVEQWVERSSAAIRDLAKGDRATALEELRQAQEFSHAAVEALNREQELSQRVLDTCLFMVRALSETSSESRAQAMAEDCRRLVPRGDPSAFMHPPAVVEALARVDESLADQTGSLRVDSLPSACAVRINGVKIGETPFEIRDLFPGRYRIQVECEPDQRGRVHTADVIAGPTEVLVDLRFDRAIETDPGLHLHYVSPSDLEKHRVSDAEEIAKAVPASALLLMSAPTPEVIELELYRGAPVTRVGLARLTAGPRGPSRGDIALAARALLHDQCTDLTGPQPVAIPCVASEANAGEGEASEEVRRAGRRPQGQFISGVTLAGIGAASLITGYALLAPRASTAEDWVRGLDATGMSDASTQQKWLSMGTGIIATSSIGAAALVAALPLALPERPKTPWWAWVSGGLGVGAIAASAYLASTVNDQPNPNASCSSASVSPFDARACVRRGERSSLAVLLGVTAAPLLTMPLVYLIRPNEKSVAANVEVLSAGATVRFSGRF
jgi:hypothetical protein